MAFCTVYLLLLFFKKYQACFCTNFTALIFVYKTLSKRQPISVIFLLRTSVSEGDASHSDLRCGVAFAFHSEISLD